MWSSRVVLQENRSNAAPATAAAYDAIVDKLRSQRQLVADPADLTDASSDFSELPVVRRAGGKRFSIQSQDSTSRKLLVCPASLCFPVLDVAAQVVHLHVNYTNQYLRQTFHMLCYIWQPVDKPAVTYKV